MNLLLICGLGLLGLFMPTEQHGELTVQISARHALNGTVYMSICNSSDDFTDDHAGKHVNFKMVEGKATYLLTGLFPDTYGLKLFVDLNGNGEMDYNLLGIPKEPYAFSNNAMGVMGQPSFTQAGFKVEAGATAAQNITLRGE